MAAQFARAPHQGRLNNGPSQHAPNAALLIDFDNVTMGVRSDLSKELKNLLNSHIIKGKVAVQRAYADWRRYPQYVVPLVENSVDLIFAPAYGSSKKNATDIRLAIDALELVFVRPEIGTFIILSGDSDFSSLVLKLKEYGKYVIGVGIRESASDILVQNCDEYYSYSVLSGLTKEGDEERQKVDPWELTERAVKQMAANHDVMRSDRLKQVMITLDPNFSEKDLGYSKFSRFLSDAVSRGRLKLKKGENGQWEVAPADGTVEAAAPAAPAPREEGRAHRDEHRRSRDGRERRGSDRSHREPRESREHREQREAPVVREAPAAVLEAPVVAEVPVLAETPAPRELPSIRGSESVESVVERIARERRAAERQTSEPTAPRPEIVAEPIAPQLGAVEQPATDLRGAYDLLRRAVESLVGKGSERVRDSDVKRRMLELQAGWDESAFGFSKFTRFLRQAHDVEVIDLHKGENGSYEVVLSSSKGRKAYELGRAPERAPVVHLAPEAATSAPRAERKAEQPRRTQGVVEIATAPAAEAKPEPKREPAVEVKPEPVTEAKSEPAVEVKSEPAVEVKGESASAAAPADTRAAAIAATLAARGIGMRTGSTRGRVGPMGPPPLLPGQAVAVAGASREEEQKSAPAAEVKPAAPVAEKPAAQEPKAAPVAEVPAAEPAPTDEGVKPARKSRTRGNRKERPAAEAKAPEAKPAEVKTPKAKVAEPKAPEAKVTEVTPAEVKAAAPAGVAERLGLPTAADEVRAYILGRYKGVGQKTIDTLFEAFGAEKLFDAFEAQPDQVRKVLGGARRGDLVLNAWQADLAQRGPAAEAAPAAPTTPAAEEPSAPEAEGSAEPAAAAAEGTGEGGERPNGARRHRGRRGGRRNGRKKTKPEVPAGSGE